MNMSVPFIAERFCMSTNDGGTPGGTRRIFDNPNPRQPIGSGAYFFYLSAILLKYHIIDYPNKNRKNNVGNPTLF